jgi:hypothetical protein
MVWAKTPSNRGLSYHERQPNTPICGFSHIASHLHLTRTCFGIHQHSNECQWVCDLIQIIPWQLFIVKKRCQNPQTDRLRGSGRLKCHSKNTIYSANRFLSQHKNVLEVNFEWFCGGWNKTQLCQRDISESYRLGAALVKPSYDLNLAHRYLETWTPQF